MKKASFLVLLLFISCHFVQKEYKDESNSDIELDSSNKKFLDSTFYVDYNAYIKAFLNGDANTAFNYLHPSIFEYFKKEYPNEIQVEDDVKQLFLEKPYKDKLQVLKNKGVKFDFKIDTPLKVISSENLIFIVAKTHLIFSKGLDEISSGEKMIGVSSDRGRSWKFIQSSNNIELTSKILKTISKSIDVDKILFDTPSL